MKIEDLTPRVLFAQRSKSKKPRVIAQTPPRGLSHLGDCFIWQGYCRPNNQSPQMQLGGERVSVVRVTYRDHIDPTYPMTGNHVSGGTVLRHKCGNPRCVNPLHLQPGSQRENVDDQGRDAVLRMLRVLPEGSFDIDAVGAYFDSIGWGRDLLRFEVPVKADN